MGRGKSRQGRKRRTRTVEVNPSANEGGSEKLTVQLKPAHEQGLGFSPVLATASGAGTHGGGKRRRNRRDRREGKAELRRGER